MRIVKIIGGVLALLLMAIVGIVVIGFIGGESNMKDYCGAVTSGTAVKDIELSTREKGYRLHTGIETKPGSGEYTSLITSSATMGRFVCEIHHDGLRVVNTRYIHND